MLRLNQTQTKSTSKSLTYTEQWTLNIYKLCDILIRFHAAGLFIFVTIHSVSGVYKQHVYRPTKNDGRFNQL